jgi:hypothetical protein
MKNPISFEVPKLVYDECFYISDNSTKLLRTASGEVSLATHMGLFNIFNAESIHRNAFKGESHLYSALHLMAKGNGWSHGQLSWLCVADPIVKQVALLHYHLERYHRRFYKTTLMNEDQSFELHRLRLPSDKKTFDINVVDFANRDYSISTLYRE